MKQRFIDAVVRVFTHFVNVLSCSGVTFGAAQAVEFVNTRIVNVSVPVGIFVVLGYTDADFVTLKVEKAETVVNGGEETVYRRFVVTDIDRDIFRDHADIVSGGKCTLCRCFAGEACVVRLFKMTLGVVADKVTGMGIGCFFKNGRWYVGCHPCFLAEGVEVFECHGLFKANIERRCFDFDYFFGCAVSKPESVCLQ